MNGMYLFVRLLLAGSVSRQRGLVYVVVGDPEETISLIMLQILRIRVPFENIE
jgi:hypothetical protein